MHRIGKWQTAAKKEHGFIYFNALLDLVLVASVMPLIIIFYLYTANFLKDVDSARIEWRLFTADLQNYLTAVDSIAIINGGTGFRVKQKGTEYDVEVYGTVIRKQKFNLGHEIMMTDISQCKFFIDGDILRISAVLMNGSEERSEYAITNP